MKISTEINSTARIVGMEKAVELIAKAGFDAWDFSMFDMCRINWSTRQVIDNPNPLNSPDYLSFARKLKNIGLEYGIVCNQSHAPFPVDVPEVRSYLCRAIECTAEAGGEICIIHPDNNKSAEENAEMYRELLPFAKSYGVKIATENMFNWDEVKNQPCSAACSTSEDFCRHVDIINDSDFVGCLDIGHAEMRTSGDGAANMIRALGHRLKALHIHDNDCFDDCHQIPFSMNIDFCEVVRALKDVSYDGYLTLEAGTFLRGYTKDNVSLGVLKLQESASRLSRMFDEL